MSTLFWNQGEKQIIQGLDVLGYRGVDQNVEKEWVSGITTISFRARYLSLLSWIVAEYYQKLVPNGSTQGVLPVYEDLIEPVRRMELILLACSRISDLKSGIKTAGLIGPDIFKNELERLNKGETVGLDFKKAGSSLGTYINVCRSFGLLAYENLPSSNWAPKLTPRTKQILHIRREMGHNSILAKAILDGGEINSHLLASEEYLFSTSCLNDSRCISESELLETALFNPESTQDENRYNRFRETAKVALTAAREGIQSSSQIIANLYRKAVSSKSNDCDQVDLSWASYDLHRRVHFALELLLSAVTDVVIDRDGATSEQIIDAWASCECPEILDQYVKFSSINWEHSLSEFIDSANSGSFLAGPVNPSFGHKMPNAGSRAVYALALLISAWSQTITFRNKHPDIPGKAAGMFEAFPIIDKMQKSSMVKFTIQLVDKCVVKSHIYNTLRKMGNGAHCSLRFFPDGRMLRPTGITLAGGFSGDRLGNVIGFLIDLGFIANGSKTELTAKGKRLLNGLEGKHA